MKSSDVCPLDIWMDFLQQQDAKKAEESDAGGVETSKGGRVCVVVLC